MQVQISKDIYSELEYIVKLHSQYGAPNPFDSVEELVNYILASVADGSPRPGSWERSMLDQMGIVADCDEHHRYRTP